MGSRHAHLISCDQGTNHAYRISFSCRFDRSAGERRLSPCARAEEPLRWKFEVGEKLDYDMVQEMKMSAAGPRSDR